MITNDLSQWPLVIVRADHSPTSVAHLEAFIASQREMLARREPYIEIADAVGASPIGAVERRLLADFLKDSEADAQELCAGLGILTSSSIVRGAVTAILWIKRPGYPIKVSGSKAAIAAFLVDAVAADGRIPGAAGKLRRWSETP